MARAPPVTPLYNHRPITFPQNQLISRINAKTKTKTKTPYKISAVQVTAMPRQQHHHESQAQAQAQAHPTLEIIGGAMDSVLPALNSTLTRIPYNPFPLIGWNCHVETVYAAYFRSLPDVKLRRECIRTQDNGSVALDWVSGDDRHLPHDSPLLILLPGLAGGSENTYVRHMLVRARSKGWHVVVFNNRGCGNSPVTTPQLFSASFTGDMREVVAHVATSYPKANLYAVGWSMGANILVRYLGEVSHTCPLSGAVSLCNPFNLVNSGEDFRYGFYDKALASSLRKIFKKHALLFEDMGGEFNIQLAVNAKYVRIFDDALTRVSFGFKSVDDYYSNSNSSDSVKHVGIPLLCIQAANDPVAPARGIPREDIKENPNCLLIVTPKGGHLGWVAGAEAPCGAPWTDPVVMDYLQHLERVAGLASHGNSVDAQQSTEALHSVEV